MRIVFVSNYYNHHQAALSEALHTITDGRYYFIQTEPMDEERKGMGWGSIDLPEFVKLSYQSRESYQECMKLIKEADFVIACGGLTVEKLIQSRIKAGKLLFRYSERVYKNEKVKKQKLLRGIKYHLCNFPYKNVYLLAASAYAPADYAKTGNFLGKGYRWGYFPEVKLYPDEEEVIAGKEPATILWVARLIELKHPELCVEVAKRLRAGGYTFKMNIIGKGNLESMIREQIRESGLDGTVCLLGAMEPHQVREHMEKAGIFMFTSDFNEGWGAVLNESMNSECAVVASHAIGAAPYLLQDGVNGFLYKNGDVDDLYVKVKSLLDSPEMAAKFGRNAYHTLADTWNANVAAKRLITIADRILSGEQSPVLYEDGPCSMAEILENDWYNVTERE